MPLGSNDWGYFNLRSDQEIFQCSGKDVIAFLNNYCTQELLQLKGPGARLGAFLTQKGKLVSDALVLNLDREVLLIFPKNFGNKVREHLKMYLDLGDVLMKDISEHYNHVLLLGGAIPGDFCPSLNPDSPGEVVKEFSQGDLKGWAWVSDRFGGPNLEILLPREASRNWEKFFSRAGARPLTGEDLEALRISAKIPKMGIDMGEDNLVAEVGLDQRATSFNKGCYLGQETTARVNTQGHVNRRLARLRLEKPLSDKLPQDLFQADKKVGRITSVADLGPEKGVLALGIIQSKALEGPEPLRLAEGIPVIPLEKN